jgi:plastocyanin
MRKPRLLFAVCVTAALTTAVPSFAQGTIEGHVKLTAAAPVNPTIPMGADPNCLQINAGTRVKQEYVLRAADGGLANVFATLRGNLPAGGSGPAAVIDQRGCTYHPRIQGARVGQTLEVRNSDKTLHNIHSLSTKGNDFNTGQPTAGMVFKYPLKSEEVMLHVKCDVHPWMTGYIGVVKHAFYAVSDATGTFKIANVPAGKQTITVWHEKYGPLTQTVDVKAGATTTVAFNYTGAEKPNASVAGLQIEEVSIPMDATAVELVAPAAR